MADPDFSRIKAIVSEALELTGSERQEFIEQACQGDPDLAAEVAAFISASDEVGEVLGTPTATIPQGPSAGQAKTPVADSPSQLLGTTIGDYTLLNLIGEGGFGSVYLAEQLQPVRRQVAMKIIKLGMDTRRVIRRFAAERQTLAMMDHPNIARVFDAGSTESGRPFFVMELVRGLPITEYCDANRLSIAQRLEIFVVVCNAIQHAHNKGVIHRDIKPSNVLVSIHDGQPVPKVIDFGIAKATDNRSREMTQLTEANQFIGTPAYMAPEQAASGMDIDTRADIYSLGVVLYELLAGTRPFQDTSPGASGDAWRTVRNIDPPKPSARLSTLGDRFAQVAARRNAAPHKLKQQIRGELDWIVIKAIDADRARRYETASELARDIRLHLSNQPIEAGPPTASYRMRKFIRRNRTAVLTGAAFVLMTAIAVGAYIHGIRSEQTKTQAALVETQQQRAQAEAGRIEAQQATSRALAAEAKANEELVFAAVSNARAARAGTRSGRRFDSLKLLDAAAKISRSAEVRDEINACLAAADMRIVRQWKNPDQAVAFDHTCAHFADFRADNTVVIRSIPDAADHAGALVEQLPARARIDAEHGAGPLVVFSPDDQRVAIACDDLHVRVFTLDGKLVLDVDNATGCDFSPDGSMLATSVLKGAIFIHNLSTGKKSSPPPRWPGTDALAYSPDGRKLAMWNQGRPTDVCLGEIATGYFNRCSHDARIRSVAWHPGAKLLAAAVDGRGICLWNVGDGPPKPVTTLTAPSAIIAIRFTHEGSLLAGAGLDGTVRLWNPADNQELVQVFCSGSLWFRLDDGLLAVAGQDGRHTLVEVADGLNRRGASK